MRAVGITTANSGKRSTLACLGKGEEWGMGGLTSMLAQLGYSHPVAREQRFRKAPYPYRVRGPSEARTGRGNALLGVLHTHIASARARKSFAPSPRQALPCMHASVVGLAEASLSSIWRAFFV